MSPGDPTAPDDPLPSDDQSSAGVPSQPRENGVEAPAEPYATLGQTPFLGLDLGSRRIGVSVSDPSHLLASPVLTLHRGRPRDDLRSLARLARRHSCGAFVLGHPLHLSGQPGPASIKAQAFAQELHTLHPIPLYLWDERLTTREAHDLLYSSGRPRQQHTALVDQVAAVLILQGFLDAIRITPSLLQRPFLPTPQV